MSSLGTDRYVRDVSVIGQAGPITYTRATASLMYVGPNVIGGCSPLELRCAVAYTTIQR
eukprot:SAG11_NODE_32632_length_282_cov_0.568306_2_plen_58_part_01